MNADEYVRSQRGAEQGSDEWLARRHGKVTASRVADIVMRGRRWELSPRSSYLGELLAERLGREVPRYESPAMKWGKCQEPHARQLYARQTGNLVVTTGFVAHPTIEMSGASPDGLVGRHGLVEIKCPTSATHMKVWLKGGVPTRHRIQMQWQMACTGRQWCDFFSYDPRIPGEFTSYCVRVKRDEKRIRQLEAEVRQFLLELEEAVLRRSMPATGGYSR